MSGFIGGGGGVPPTHDHSGSSQGPNLAQSVITGLAGDLAGKAASSHAHAQADVTGLESALSGKAASSHSHAQGDVTGLESALSGKAASSHAHASGDITGFEGDVRDACPYATASRSTTQSYTQGPPTYWNTVSFDAHAGSDDYWDAEQPTRLTAPANGIYLVGGCIGSDATSGPQAGAILLNGIVVDHIQARSTAMSSAGTYYNFSGVLSMNADQYVELALCNWSTNCNMLANAQMWIRRIG